MALTLGKAKIILEKIAKNQSWKPDNQCCQKIEEVLEEVCALPTKMYVLFVDIRYTHKEIIRKHTDIGEHFTQEIFQRRQ